MFQCYQLMSRINLRHLRTFSTIFPAPLFKLDQAAPGREDVREYKRPPSKDACESVSSLFLANFKACQPKDWSTLQ